VHQEERRLVARFENPHSDRRIRQLNAPAPDLHTTGGKQPTLGLLERQRPVIIDRLGLNNHFIMILASRSGKTRLTRC
jgi:hypothetical protein